MATAIFLSSENSVLRSSQPECDQASCCYWFEKTASASSRCANRDSMVCRKRLDDVFSPYEPKKTAVE